MKTHHFVNQSRYLKGFKTHRNLTLPLLFRTASFERSLLLNMLTIFTHEYNINTLVP